MNNIQERKIILGHFDEHVGGIGGRVGSRREELRVRIPSWRRRRWSSMRRSRRIPSFRRGRRWLRALGRSVLPPLGSRGRRRSLDDSFACLRSRRSAGGVRPWWHEQPARDSDNRSWCGAAGGGGGLMTHKYRGSQQSSSEVKLKFIDSTQGEPKNTYKP